jgi:uncharacterized hydrophobic protein (TIGR00341 family)
MGLRLIEMHIANERAEDVAHALEDTSAVDRWHAHLADSEGIWQVLASSEHAESIVDALEEAFSEEPGFRLLLYDIEATIPRPDSDDEDEDGEAPDSAEDESDENRAPINIEELYEKITDQMGPSWNYVVLVLLSVVVAAVGIFRDDMILVIAAMIIAPLLQPNMALSLATTLADRELGWRAVKVTLLGLGVGAAAALVLGAALPFEYDQTRTSLRTSIGTLDVVVAASAGVAGALSYTSAKAGGVVGVMIAVALLPPLVSFGMLLGAGHWPIALAPLLLLVFNIICINLAGVATFFIQRIRPRALWKKERAERAARNAVLLWLVLLSVLAAIGYFFVEFWERIW